MQFAHAACVQSHLDAGHRFRSTKLPLCHLAGPAAVRLPHMRVRKRETEVLYRARIRGGRIEQVRVLTLADWVTGDGIGTTNSRRSAWLEYPIARLGSRRRCARQHPSSNGSRCKHIPAREFTHVLSPSFLYRPQAESEADGAYGAVLIPPELLMTARIGRRDARWSTVL